MCPPAPWLRGACASDGITCDRFEFTKDTCGSNPAAAAASSGCRDGISEQKRGMHPTVGMLLSGQSSGRQLKAANSSRPGAMCGSCLTSTNIFGA